MSRLIITVLAASAYHLQEQAMSVCDEFEPHIAHESKFDDFRGLNVAAVVYVGKVSQQKQSQI